MTNLAHSTRWWACSSLTGACPLSPSCLSKASLHGTTETSVSLQLWDLMSPVTLAACLEFYSHAFSAYCDVSLHSFSAGAQSLSSMKLLEMNEPLSGRSTLYSVGASCAPGCLKFLATFSKPLTERPGLNGGWPRGFTLIFIVPAGIQPLNRMEKGEWQRRQPPPSGAGWEGLGVSCC